MLIVKPGRATRQEFVGTSGVAGDGFEVEVVSQHMQQFVTDDSLSVQEQTPRFKFRNRLNRRCCMR